MPVTTSAGTGQPVSHAAARLADVNGLIDPAQPEDAGDSIRALVPSSNWGRDTGGILGIPLLYTERFLLTTHSGPCRALAAVQRGWDDLPHDVKANGPALLFFILNQLIGSFEPDLVQLDSKLDQIQLALLGGSPPGRGSSSTFSP